MAEPRLFWFRVPLPGGLHLELGGTEDGVEWRVFDGNGARIWTQGLIPYHRADAELEWRLIHPPQAKSNEKENGRMPDDDT